MPEKIPHEPHCYVYIRFSTQEQENGDSLRRQLSLAKSFAKEKNLTINDSYILVDDGLSGFSGAHKKYGKFGEFLKSVEQNKIPRGSFLLIESLDRLSRQDPLEAFTPFQTIINKDITIETTGSIRSTYSKEELTKNPMSILSSMLEMIRANSESSHKSERLSEAWQNKKLKASKDKTPMTSKAPAWVNLNKEIMVYEEIPERCKLVKEIFEMSAEGIGMFSITRSINKQKIPTWQPNILKNTQGWRKSYIYKILHNRAVLGEFQPHKLIERKKPRADIKGMKKSIPDGDPITGYFPPIVSEELFYRVQERLKANTGRGGKTGKISNLFSHVAKCGYCGSSMSFVNKGALQSDKSFVCDSGRRGVGCKYVSFPHHEFEEAFLRLCNELNVEDLIVDADNVRAKKIKQHKDKIESINGQIDAVETKINSLNIRLDVATNPDQIKDMVAQQAQAYEERTQLQQNKKILKSKLSTLENQGATDKGHLETIQKLFHQLTTKSGEELILLRFKLRSAIRELVKEIKVFPEGMREKTLSFKNFKPEYITTMKEEIKDQISSIEAIMLEFDDSFPPDQVKDAKTKLKTLREELRNYDSLHTGKEQREFHVFFKSGAFKAIGYDPMEGYGISSELNEKYLRIGDGYKMKGNFLTIGKQIDKKSISPTSFGSGPMDVSDSLAKRINKMLQKPDSFQPKFKKVLFNPHPEKKRMIETTSQIIELRDKGLKWAEVKEVLETRKIKTFKGYSTWHAGTLSRIYKEAKGKK
ncbi:recombinase family protein [Desulfocicer niacini]